MVSWSSQCVNVLSGRFASLLTGRYCTKCSHEMFMCDQDHYPKCLRDVAILTLTYLV